MYSGRNVVIDTITPRKLISINWYDIVTVSKFRNIDRMLIVMHISGNVDRSVTMEMNLP